MSERRQVLLRLDPAVHDALIRWANDEFRSVKRPGRDAAATGAGRRGTNAGPCRTDTQTRPPPRTALTTPWRLEELRRLAEEGVEQAPDRPTKIIRDIK
jgi:hypothetical protein